MVWIIDITHTATKQIKRLDKPIRSRVLVFLTERMKESNNPRKWGKHLQGDKKGLWRYRIGDYRLICYLDDSKTTITLLRVAHRRHIYN